MEGADPVLLVAGNWILQDKIEELKEEVAKQFKKTQYWKFVAEELSKTVKHHRELIKRQAKYIEKIEKRKK